MKPHAPLVIVSLAACSGAHDGRTFGSPLAAPAAGWTYDVTVEPGLEALDVQAAFAKETSEELTVDTGGEPFVRDVAVLEGGAWRGVERTGNSFVVVACARGCRVRYRFMLREATHSNAAQAIGASTQSLPSIWLLRPLRAPAGTPFRFHVRTAPGDTFATGVFPDESAPDTYAGRSSARFELPYSAFGALRNFDIERGRVRVAMLPGRLRNETDVVAWVARSAAAVRSFYGRFPVPRLLVMVRPTTGEGADEGRTVGNAGAAIDIDVGEDSSEASLHDDWILVHEMVHTALPNLHARHRWLEEGLATYVEPLTRVRAGMKPEDALWRGWITGMPNGLPEAGDQGLDRTPTWGRTYWGGALFCLLADVEIRARTHGAKSLDDALHAILDAGGNIATAWTIDHVIDVGDAATGVGVLRELYARHANTAVSVDLDALWQKLGVAWNGHAITYDDHAPLASLRRAMTASRTMD